MLLTEQREITPVKWKTDAGSKIKLTTRDLEIIKFCLEMRFATIAQIHHRFFKNLTDGSKSSCDRWTKGRLYQLRQHDYLKLQKNRSTGESLILPTLKGYLLARNILFSEDLPKPIGAVDFRQFEHDRKLIDCRTLLEDQGKITKWISERSLQMSADLMNSFRDESVADGLYYTRDGHAAFFELELSLKTRDRIKEKIRRYVHLLRSEKAIFPGLKSVHYVCSKPSIFNAIEAETKIYGSLFKVQMIEEFFKDNNEVKNDIANSKE